tara:strand:- start:1133 stop:1402 length:270 start_codon:yes stop_codon:yes gene_type:complete
LIAQGVPAEQRAFSDDPDKDGIINAYELLSRTDADDPSSGEPPLVEIDLLTPMLYAESIFDGLMHYSFRTTTRLEENSQFARPQLSVNQ